MKLYYQDLQEVGQDENARAAFVLEAIRNHKASFQYRMAQDAFLYYTGENPTIYKYEKIIYDLQGRAQRDMWSANHKISSSFFGFTVDQLASYLFGNGVTFKNDSTKDKLGKTFDQQLFDLAVYAQVGGVSFGFYNYDHLEKFKITEFAPLEDADTGALMAGVRFWQVGELADRRPLRATLYELDGYTDYIQRSGENVTVLHPKRPYINVVRTSEIDGTEYLNGRNYPGFPIVPWKNNDDEKSSLVGKRTTIDSLDLAMSNMMNNVSEGNLIYWVLQNCGGMDEEADAQFIQQVLTTHVVHPDGGSDSTAEPHTIEAPFQGTQATIDMLQKKAYQDFQAFDASAVTAGNQTATAIKASYVPLDLKADKFETQATRFIHGILQIAGIDDEPTYTRNKIVNTSEEIQTLLMGAEHLSDEYVTRKVLTLLGDADLYDEVMSQREADEMTRVQDEPDDTQDNQLDAQGVEE